MQFAVEFTMSDQENKAKDKEEKEIKSSNISEATEKDWADFFNVQEDLNYMFDR